MKQYIFFTLLISLLITSCKKGKSPEPDPVEVVHKVKTETSQCIVSTYQYYNQGRISKATLFDNSWYEYVYATGLVTFNGYNAAGSLQSSAKYELNADGLVETETGTYPSPWGPYKYTYNSAKQLLSTSYLDGANGNALLATESYYYSGQLDSVRRTDGAGKLRQRNLYEYYSDINNTISDQYKGYLFWGKQSPKAIKKITYHYYNSNGTLVNTQVNNYTYTSDAQGRIITEDRMINTTSGSTIYTYY